MDRNPKPDSDVSQPAGEKAETPETPLNNFPALLARGVERLADLQKQTLEVLSSQNKDISSTLRETLRATPAAPGTTVLELTGEAVNDWVSALKNILDLTVQQSAQALDYVRQGTGVASKSAALLTDLAWQSARRAIAAQQITLEFAALQTKAITEAVKRQAGIEEELPFEAVTYSMQRRLDALIENQKEFLAATKALTNETSSGAVGSGSSQTRGLKLVPPPSQDEHD
jgi:hypothetical protein